MCPVNIALERIAQVIGGTTIEVVREVTACTHVNACGESIGKACFGINVMIPPQKEVILFTEIRVFWVAVQLRASADVQIATIAVPCAVTGNTAQTPRASTIDVPGQLQVQVVIDR